MRIWGAQLDTTPLDNFRLFAEEADLLQGVQMSADISTGFAAIANEMMGGYKDEYPKGEAVVVGLMGGLPGTGVGPGEVEGDRERAVREMSVSPHPRLLLASRWARADACACD